MTPDEAVLLQLVSHGATIRVEAGDVRSETLAALAKAVADKGCLTIANAGAIAAPMLVELAQSAGEHITFDFGDEF
jgi:hypothetical protein